MKLSVIAVLAILLVGCKEDSQKFTPSQEALTQPDKLALEYKAYMDRNNTVEILRKDSSNLDTLRLDIMCVRGIKYYERVSGHSVWFTPVVDSGTMHFTSCAE